MRSDGGAKHNVLNNMTPGSQVQMIMRYLDATAQELFKRVDKMEVTEMVSDIQDSFAES